MRCRSGYAVTLIRKMNDVEIDLQNFTFIQGSLQIQCVKDLLNFTFHRDVIVSRHIFDHLLRDGRGAKAFFSSQKIVKACGCRPIPIYPVMLKKALVLNGYKSIYQVFG